MRYLLLIGLGLVLSFNSFSQKNSIYGRWERIDSLNHWCLRLEFKSDHTLISYNTSKSTSVPPVSGKYLLTKDSTLITKTKYGQDKEKIMFFGKNKMAIIELENSNHVDKGDTSFFKRIK